MGYHNHKSTPPRSILVILGGFLAVASMWAGTLITVTEYHRAMTQSAEPVEMTWDELVDNGLTDNCHVRLMDVELNGSNPLEQMEDVFGAIDDPDDLGQFALGDGGEVMKMMAEMNANAVLEAMLAPTKVVPAGTDPEDCPPRIVISRSQWAMNTAFAEVEQSGTLTGRFTLTRGAGFEKQFADLLLRGDGLADDEEDENVAAAEEMDVAAEDEGLRYVFEPANGVMSATDARQWLSFSVFMVALGLVICGMGGPSVVCCVFFPGHSMLSLLGYPLRYGRATWGTRVLYAVIGAGLLGFGYHQMFIDAKLGQLDGDILSAIPGFWALGVGGGALLGSVMSVVMEKLNMSLDPDTGRKNAQPKMSYARACHVGPVESQVSSNYVDPQIAGSGGLPQRLQAIADTLSAIDFLAPASVQLSSTDGVEESLIQLGCQKMVVVNASESPENVQARLTSVLSDGLTIVTVSDPTAEEKTRTGTNGMYCINASDDPTELLSAHLEQIVRSAEQRDSQVVEIEPDETTEVALLATRVLADVQTQYGEKQLEVDGCQYGRFHFPPAPIESGVEA